MREILPCSGEMMGFWKTKPYSEKFGEMRRGVVEKWGPVGMKAGEGAIKEIRVGSQDGAG